MPKIHRIITAEKIVFMGIVSQTGQRMGSSPRFYSFAGVEVGSKRNATELIQ